MSGRLCRFRFPTTTVSTAPPSIVAKCEGVVLCVIVCDGLLVVSCVVWCCSCCVCVCDLFLFTPSHSQSTHTLTREHALRSDSQTLVGCLDAIPERQRQSRIPDSQCRCPFLLLLYPHTLAIKGALPSNSHTLVGCLDAIPERQKKPIISDSLCRCFFSTVNNLSSAFSFCGVSCMI